MRRLLIPALFLTLPAAVVMPAQAQESNPANIKGHYIGESIAQFLRAEPEAQQEADVCRDHTRGNTCIRLVAAIRGGGRAEVSTSDGADFILDGGRLVKVTLLAPGDTRETISDVNSKFGLAASEKLIAAQSSSGSKWQNHLYSWSTGKVYAKLYEDNNPLLSRHEPVLVVETESEHILEEAELAQKTQALNKKPAEQFESFDSF